MGNGNDDAVDVSVTLCPLNDVQLQQLRNQINPLVHDGNYGVDMFIETVDIVRRTLLGNM